MKLFLYEVKEEFDIVQYFYAVFSLVRLQELIFLTHIVFGE